uniref:Uncharacterized protein n=1 Tax=Moorena producens (strain JHB) TaxID=1454205 RepID=A0A1D9FVU0_MOOP1
MSGGQCKPKQVGWAVQTQGYCKLILSVSSTAHPLITIINHNSASNQFHVGWAVQTQGYCQLI